VNALQPFIGSLVDTPIFMLGSQEEGGDHGAVYDVPSTERDLKPKLRPDVDRKKLRDQINAKYENTLRYLGR
jgi:hypothetical protein